MTSAEYDAHNGSLAYVLAVSAAFENKLWIVGMSLDDQYLRDHLKGYGSQINRIRWFNSEDQLKRYESWARDAGVTLVPVDWSRFWSTIGHALDGQVRRAGVMTAWSHVLTVALQGLIDGGPAGQLEDSARKIPLLSPAALRVKAQSRATYRHIFDPGEGLRLLPDGFDRLGIEDELQASMGESADTVIGIQRAVADRGADVGRDVASALESARPRLPRMRRMY
jgi:hypothetical protein